MRNFLVVPITIGTAGPAGNGPYMYYADRDEAVERGVKLAEYHCEGSDSREVIREDLKKWGRYTDGEDGVLVLTIESLESSYESS